ncbi:MAG TPA: DUF4303 domain-containing protein [Humisphaera sp.]
MPAAKFDFDALRADIREGAREAFAAVRKAHPGERFYAYALYSDDDPTTVCAAANTEEAVARNLERARGRKDYDAADDAETAAMYRWSTGDWAYEGLTSAKLNAVCKVLFDRAIGGGQTEAARKAFRKGVYDAMIAALAELDAEGFFGKGADRKKVTLFCSISDSDDALKLENRSAKALNPAPVVATFAKRWKA